MSDEVHKGLVRIRHSHFPDMYLSISTLMDGNIETYPYFNDTPLGDYSRPAIDAQGLTTALEMFEAQMWNYWRYE